MLPSGFHMCHVVKITCTHTIRMRTHTYTLHTHPSCIPYTYVQYTYIMHNTHTHTHTPHMCTTYIHTIHIYHTQYTYTCTAHTHIHTFFCCLKEREIKTLVYVISTLSLGILTHQTSLLGLFLVRPCVRYQEEALPKTDSSLVLWVSL